MAFKSIFIEIYSCINNAVPSNFSVYESDCVHTVLKSNYVYF